MTTSILVAAPALAQTMPPSAGPIVPNAPPEKIAPPDESLSGRLSQRKATIVPPNVDPGITVKPSNNATATMPIIPPPGSPGGNGSVVPK